MLVKLHYIDNKQVVSQCERLYNMFSVKINTAYGKNVKDFGKGSERKQMRSRLAASIF